MEVILRDFKMTNWSNRESLKTVMMMMMMMMTMAVVMMMIMISLLSNRLQLSRRRYKLRTDASLSRQHLRIQILKSIPYCQRLVLLESSRRLGKPADYQAICRRRLVADVVGCADVVVAGDVDAIVRRDETTAVA